jgi:hypothetical protein
MDNSSHLYILWTTPDPVTAEKMVFMYGGNTLRNGWWEEVTIIIWGASALLAGTDAGIQEKIKELISLGVEFTACKRCAEDLGVDSTLEELGVEVKFWGAPLTELLKSGAHLITI